MKTVVIIPTYNERETIAEVIARVRKKQLDVLVVDDNSPDGTGGIVKDIAKKDSRVHLLKGEKQGLGFAYRRGMEYAINALGADAIVEMDADLSHNPDDLPNLLRALKTSDFVIGSRYVSGGSIQGWGVYRTLVSWGGNVVARLVAGLHVVHDCTAGFRALRSTVVSDIDWDTFPAKGYGFQIALLHHAVSKNARVREVPVTFVDRRVGESKLGLADILEFVWISALLGLRSYALVLRFLAVGFSGLVVNIGILSLLVRVFALQEWISILVAVETSILWNYWWHDTWTFRHRVSHSWIVRLGRYHITSLLGIIFNIAVFLILRQQGLFLEAANIIAIGIATLSNYLLSRFWAWK